MATTPDESFSSYRIASNASVTVCWVMISSSFFAAEAGSGDDDRTMAAEDAADIDFSIKLRLVLFGFVA